MIKTWTYNGVEYQSEWLLRQEIFKQERKAVGEAPELSKESFWSEHGVIYKETPEPEPTPEELEAIELETAKAERAEKVKQIKVEVDGMLFDGDEAAQSRMTRAITAAETTGLTKTVWVLADDTVAEVTKEQLQQALAKAMVAMSELWTIPYTNNKD